ncbi:4-hydroxy-tetrahydrodipicolinate synthase [Carboxylicivirga sp. N1Y132]|uniref:4-hydroxy-tetrahydrodipicolinate synthase n=1 Tax=Carboxylicivirga marina TaxID=2800988 RepID=A0ABS1HFC6_9BACT|nr:4-hydroxy-tetrahydrodipicolinate synthase [Carboxylicivirga marina]
MSPQQLTGTGVALVTPFDNNKAVDHSALKKLVNYVIDGGVNYLVALGTTAETATLSNKEKLEVIHTIKEANSNRLPVILGMGSNNTDELIDTINRTDFDGVDAILSVTPFYNKPTQEGLYQHYKAIADVSPVPVILYNVPSRTGCNLNADTCLKLASNIENVVAVKEASGNWEQIMQIIKHKPQDFAVLSGDDATTLPLIASGANGVISVIANACPVEFSSMVNAAVENNMPKARQIHYSLIDLINNIFVEGNPAGIKALLEMRQIIDNQLRLPLVSTTDKLYNELKGYFNAF